jgi:hypothetical protein
MSWQVSSWTIPCLQCHERLWVMAVRAEGSNNLQPNLGGGGVGKFHNYNSHYIEKYDHESCQIQNQEWLCWHRPTTIYQTRPDQTRQSVMRWESVLTVCGYPLAWKHSVAAWDDCAVCCCELASVYICHSDTIICNYKSLAFNKSNYQSKSHVQPLIHDNIERAFTVFMNMNHTVFS